MAAKSTDIDISQWPQGIADSPHLGIADMRNINILSSPGAAVVNYKTSALTQPATVSALAFTVVTATDVFTVASTSGWYNGMAITLNTIVTSTGISTGRVYWIGNLTATTFKLYKNPSRNAGKVVDVTGSDGSGTLSSYVMGQIIDKAVDYRGGGNTPKRNYIFFLDANGLVWWIDNTSGTLTNNLIYLGNDTLTGSTGRAITIYKRNIIVFRTSSMDAYNTAGIDGDYDPDAVYSSNGWTYGWDSVSSVTQTTRPVLVGQDDIIYYGNSGRVGSIAEVAGQTFDPTNSATYTKTVSAQKIPKGDDVYSLAELGVNLLIGGIREYIYPWDRSSTSFDLPIIVPDIGIYKMVTINQLVFVFAGTRGRIYVTNGSGVSLFKKIPDYVSGVNEPYYTWNDATGWKGQLYFGFTATKNDGTALTSTGGVWAIDLKTGAFRGINKLSYDTYGGSINVLLPNVLSSVPVGIGLYVAWTNSSTYGIDVSSQYLYSSYEAMIETGLLSVGSPIAKRVITHLMAQLAKLLTTGQGVRVSYRKNLTDSYSSPITFDFATYSGIAGFFKDFPLTDAEFVQLKIEMTANSSSSDSPELRRLLLV